jgi:steroid delta-isomerase-like uncharacterized protein
MRCSVSEQNKELVRRYLEQSINAGSTEALDEFTTLDYVGHMAGFPDFGREAHKQLLSVFRSAFPDLHIDIQVMVAEGDLVVHRSTYSGTQLGAFQGIPPTGKHVSITGMNISRIKNGKVAEDWTLNDMFGMLQQLGAIPAPAGAA